MGETHRVVTLHGSHGEVEFAFPRVTHILDVVLAKPALLPWGQSVLLQGIEALGKQYGQGNVPLDVPSLKQLLKQNALRPEDRRDEAASKGTDVHTALELMIHGFRWEKPYLVRPEGMEVQSPGSLVESVLADAPKGTVPVSEETYDHLDALWDWFTTSSNIRSGNYVSEVDLVSFKDRYTGSADLVFPGCMIVDLKTSKGTYYSHDLQLEAYRQSWNEMNPAAAVPYGATYLLHINPASHKGWKMIQTGALEEAWRSCLTLYNEMNGKR